LTDTYIGVSYDIKPYRRIGILKHIHKQHPLGGSSWYWVALALILGGYRPYGRPLIVAAIKGAGSAWMGPSDLMGTRSPSSQECPLGPLGVLGFLWGQTTLRRQAQHQAREGSKVLSRGMHLLSNLVNPSIK